MRADLIIRAARPDEAERLGRIGFDAWAEGEHGALDAGRADRDKLLREFLDFCAARQATMVVADEGGQAVGWGAREDGDGYVSDLWVAPASQGRGIGGRLLATMELAIAKAGYEAVTLETRAGAERAIRFYERNGYRIVWRREKPTPALGYPIDKVGLEKPLQRTAG